MKPGFAAALALLALASTDAAADPCPACDQYAGAVSVRSLSDQVAGLGLSFLDTDGAALTMNEARAHKRLLESAKAMIPAECREYLTQNLTPRQVRLVARYSSQAGQAAYLASGARSRDMLDFHGQVVQLFNEADKKCVGFSTPQEVTACREAEQLKAFNQATRAIGSKNLRARAAAAARDQGVVNPLQNFKNNEVQVLQGFHAVITAKDEAEMKSRLAGYRHLSFNDKITIATMWGSRVNDSVSMNDTTKAKRDQDMVGFSFNDSNAGVRNNMARNLYNRWSDDPALTEAEYAGVCRHEATGEVTMLRAMGVRHAYAVRMNTITGSGHQTVIAQDPHDPKSVSILDWGSTVERTPGNGAALFQGVLDGDTQYEIFDDKGPVAVRDSEWGKFVTEAAGFNIRTLDPLARSHGSLQAADITIDQAGHFQFRVVAGEDGTGGKNLGVAGNASWGEGTFYEGKAGAYVGRMSRALAVDAGYVQGDRVNIDVLYARLEQAIYSPDVQITPAIRARIEAVASGTYMLTYQEEGVRSSDGKKDFGGSQFDRVRLQASTGLRLQMGDPFQDRVSGTATAHINAVSTEGGNPRENVKTYVDRMILQNMVFTAEGRLRLSSTPEGRAYLVAATTVLVDEFGTRGRGTVGLVTPSAAAQAYVEGRLAKDDANFVDGAGREAGLSLTYKPIDWLTLGATGAMSLEENADGSGVGGRFMGTGALEF